MTKLHDFLVEHAKFPFPQPANRSVGTADISSISSFDVGLLEREWKPNHAVRDNMLVQKLCSTLEIILGDTVFPADVANKYLARFSPKIQLTEYGFENSTWTENPSEIQVSVLALHSRPSNSG
jgi:hypothetical protein